MAISFLKVLFLCPHAAAKSVLAMTYFADLAEKAGLAVVATNAGTEPDPTIAPTVADYLKREGFDLNGLKPSLLTDDHLAAADMVVSMGCISAEDVPSDVEFIDWSDIPQLSAGFQESRDQIYAHVQQLVQDLLEVQ